MSRATIVLHNDTDRQKAVHWIKQAPQGTRVQFMKPLRTLPQNNRMWAMLTDIACQARHHGTRLSPEDWKLIFLDALRKEMRIVYNLDGNGFVNLGRSSSSLTRQEMRDMIELMHAWGAQNNIIFHDGKET